MRDYVHSMCNPSGSGPTQSGLLAKDFHWKDADQMAPKRGKKRSGRKQKNERKPTLRTKRKDWQSRHKEKAKNWDEDGNLRVRKFHPGTVALRPGYISN